MFKKKVDMFGNFVKQPLSFGALLSNQKIIIFIPEQFLILIAITIVIVFLFT